MAASGSTDRIGVGKPPRAKPGAAYLSISQPGANLRVEAIAERRSQLRNQARLRDGGGPYFFWDAGLAAVATLAGTSKSADLNTWRDKQCVSGFCLLQAS